MITVESETWIKSIGIDTHVDILDIIKFQRNPKLRSCTHKYCTSSDLYSVMRKKTGICSDHHFENIFFTKYLCNCSHSVKNYRISSWYYRKISDWSGFLNFRQMNLCRAKLRCLLKKISRNFCSFINTTGVRVKFS